MIEQKENMAEQPYQVSSHEVTMLKTETGAVFFIAEMTAMTYLNNSSICFYAEIALVDVEISDG